MRRVVGLGAVIAVLASASYAFTATNTVPDSNAGFGSGTISGYTITNVAYALDGTDPSKLASASFTISPATAGMTVKLRVVPAGSFYNCTVTVATGATTCSMASSMPTVSAATSFDVVAHQ
jgi:hypothetical protein